MIAVIRSWLPSLPRTVWVLQAGSLVNSFGFGLVLPVEIIYLHAHRGFSIPVAGLVLSMVMVTGAVIAGPAGALVDRLGGKPVLLASAVLLTAGYGLMAFVHHPWQAFTYSGIAGIGSGAVSTAAPALTTALTRPAERVAVFTFSRVVVNLGIGLGAIIGGAIAASGELWTFQLLYLGDAATFLIFGLFAACVPNARPPAPQAAGETPVLPPRTRSYRLVLADRPFLLLMVANIVFITVGFVLFSYVMPPFARNHTSLGTGAIGIVLFTNTTFIILGQLPIARYAGGRRRLPLLAVMAVIWGVACLVTLAAETTTRAAVAFLVLALAAIVFGVGECLHAVVIGPLVSDLAPADLVGRYFSVLTFSSTVGLAVGPSVGATLLSISPGALWGSMAVAVIIAGTTLLRLDPRLPETARRRPVKPPAVPDGR